MKQAGYSELRSKLERRREALKQIESRMEPHWKDLRDYIQPFRGRFAGEKPDQHEPYMGKIIDGTALRARRVLSAGMQSGLTSPSRQWFKLSVHDPDLADTYEIREWCDEVQRRMLVVMAGSSFYHALHSVYDEIATFGTGTMFILPDFDSVIDCRTLTVGTYYLGRAQHDYIDSVYRDMFMTAGAIAAEFGKENCSNAVVTAAEKAPDTIFEVRHAIEPDENNERFPYRSVYWEPSAPSDTILRISGFKSQPFMTPRWHAIDTDIYGYGPGSEALPDAKTLQVMARDRAEGIKKQVAPPVVADAALRGSEVRTHPNGITYAPAGRVGPMIQPLYNVPLDIADLQTSITEVQESIKSTMYVDMFLMLNQSDNPQMTAREVIERHDEKMLGLGPVLERLEWELLTPAIDRIYNIMNDAGLIPEPPDSIQGQEIKIEFTSILAQAQQMMGLKPIEQIISFAGSLAGVDPSVMDGLNLDEALREYSHMVGSPEKILRSEQEIQQIRQQREQQQQQMQQAQQEQQEATAANQGAMAANQGAQAAKVMSDVDTGPDTALGALLGYNQRLDR